MRIGIRAGLVLAACGLAACSEDSGGGSGNGGANLPAEFQDELTDYLLTEAAIDRRFDTREGNMPTSGSASFDGLARIGLGATPEAYRTDLVGDVGLVTDFGRGTISGEATDFVGRVDRGPAEDFDGSLRIAGADIIGNEAFGNMRGSLASDDHRVTIDANMDGRFVGNPEPVGIEFESVDGNTDTLDGERVPSVVTVVAERD